MKNTLYGLIIVLITFSCANKRLLTGGEKDSTPPQIVNQYPENLSTNINPSKIEITFDEYFSDNNAKQNIIITPYIDNLDNIKIKGKKLIINFNKPFDDNTTYTIYLDNCIKDITENNISKNIKYIFSTGNYIDSLKINAKIVNVFNQKPLSEALVSLYKSEDTSSINKTKPLYFSYTDATGKATLSNLKKGNYKIYAIKDKNANLLYDEDESIAFIDTIVTPDTNDLNIVEMHPTNKKKPKNQKINDIINIGNTYQIILNKGIINFSLLDTNYNKKNITYWFYDSYNINIENNDSLFIGYILLKDSINQIDTLDVRLKKDPKNKWLKINTQKNKLKPGDSLEITLSNIPKLINDSLMYFVTDTTLIPNNGWKLDSNRNILRFYIPNDLEKITLHIDSAAIKNDLIWNKKYTQPINILQELETGIIKGTIKCKEPSILQLLNESNKVIEEIKNPNKSGIPNM